MLNISQIYRSHLGKNKSTNRAMDSPEKISEDVNKWLVKNGNLSNVVKKRFDTSGDSSGVKWKPLKESTKEQRAEEGMTGPVLVKTGRLMHAAINGEEKADSRGITKTLTNFDQKIAGYLNSERPFYKPPSSKEAKSLVRIYMERVSKFFMSVLNGSNRRT